MIQIIRSTIPNFSPILNGNIRTIIGWLSLLLIMGATAFLVSTYASNRFKGNKKKTALCFMTISLFTTLAMLSFFGFATTAIKGSILCLILILSSYQDIKKRECDDYIHVMILITALIGTELAALPGMIISALVTIGLMIIPILIADGDIGGADIKLSAATVFLLGFRRGTLGLILGFILAIVINLIKNKGNAKANFPLLPYLSVGFLTAYFI